MQQYALGIDGGGSKCDAVLVDTAGRIVGWGRGGSVQPFYDTWEAVRQSYLDALDGALGDLRGAELWVGTPMRRRPPWEERVAQAGAVREVALATEPDMALAAAGVEWGVVVLAGTGSFVNARTPDGYHRHLGGLGPLLGDYGSGYEVGLAGMRAAFASHWTAARATTLAEAVPPALGLDDLRRVFQTAYMEGLDRRQVASLARVVDEQAEAGDRVAAEILRQAADDLFTLVRDMVHEMGLAEQEFPLVAGGSVAMKSRLWWERMSERVAEIAPRARPVTPRLMMAAGSALLTLRRMGVEWTPELLANLERTQNEFLQRLSLTEAGGHHT
jgi:N-acetylglucosamine kinase-like BadF-type ATPase